MKKNINKISDYNKNVGLRNGLRTRGEGYDSPQTAPPRNTDPRPPPNWFFYSNFTSYYPDPSKSSINHKMPCHRKKVIRKKGKRYYRVKSGLVRLKGGKKAPRRRR